MNLFWKITLPIGLLMLGLTGGVGFRYLTSRPVVITQEYSAPNPEPTESATIPPVTESIKPVSVPPTSERPISFVKLHEFPDTTRIVALEVYDDRLWAATDAGLYSYDGFSWTLSTHPIKHICDLTVYKNKLFTSSRILGGQTEVGAIYSFDGKEWAVSFDPSKGTTDSYGYLACITPYVYNPHIGVSDFSDNVLDNETIGSMLYVGTPGQGMLYKYNGKTWKEEAYPIMDFSSNLFPTALYKNELYLPSSELFTLGKLFPQSILVFRNKQWQPLENAPVASITSLISFNNQLYAFGSGAETDKSNPGSVFIYDDSKWKLLQPFPAPVGSAAVYKGKIFAGTVSYLPYKGPATIYVAE